MIKNLAFKSLKFVAKDLIGDFLYWPIWWYTKGLLNTLFFSWRSIANQQAVLGLAIWIKNIFTPMYGQYDWEGRIISFVMRLVQIMFRSVLLAIWTILALLPIVIWVLIPLVIVYQVYLNFVALF